MSKRVSYSAYPDFVLRVPSLPLCKLEAIPQNKADLDSFVKDQWADSFLRNSILLASSDLANRIDDCILRDKPIDDQVIRSFINYYTRACTRPTPFGLFAGVVSGKIKKQDNIQIDLNDAEMGQLSCRLDMEYLVSHVQSLSQQKAFRKSQVYKVASTLYKIGDQYRYISSSISKTGIKKYRIESFDSHPIIEPLFQFCKNGKRVSELSKFVEDHEYSPHEAENFINDLIEMHVLVNELEPVLSGEEYGQFLKNKLEDHENKNQQIENLVYQVESLENLMAPSEFELKRKKIEQFANRTDFSFSSNKLIQGDFLRAANSVEIPEELCNKVLLGIRIMKSLSDQKPLDPLGEFKTHFIRRFGSREVPLLEVMDQEFGIGLKGPLAQQNSDSSGLLDDLVKFGTPGKHHKRELEPLIPNFGKGLTIPSHYAILNSTDIQQLQIHQGEWPRQLYAICSLLGDLKDPEVYIHMAGQGHLSSLLGRFGFLPDSGIRSLIDSCIQEEISTNPGNLYADILHLPESRTGNILQRPSSYPYEIPFMAQSLLSQKNQISLNNILVSLEKNQVVLKTKTTGEKIVPCLNNAHNYSFSQLALYEFLVKCGKQGGVANYSLSEDKDQPSGFIRGLKYDNLIFRLPQWNLRVSDLEKRERKEEVTGGALLKNWAVLNHLPDQVILKEGDRHLYVNWKNQNLIDCCWEVVRKRRTARFELYPYANGSPVKENTLSLSNQLVICFHQMN